MNTPTPINYGGPAFPTSDPNYDKNWGTTGLSMRDWFAGQALSQREIQLPIDQQAKEAYALADAMLAAREAKQ